MDDIGASIALSKLDAALRQLETAVVLWFEERDPVSIHTLAAAAHRVVHDLAEQDGSGAFLLDSHRLAQWGFEPREFKKAIRRAETFFKHAKDDPDDIFTFSADETESVLASAMECYHRLVPVRSRLLAMFMGWFHFRNPETLSETVRDGLAELLPRINKLSRREFFDELRELDFVRMVYR